MKVNYISGRKRALIAYAETHKIPIGGTFNYKGKKLFFDNYQLCRNICYITSDNKFVVFIFPRNNTTVFSQYEAFRHLIQSRQSNVKVVYWEDIVNCNSEFFAKYFK